MSPIGETVPPAPSTPTLEPESSKLTPDIDPGGPYSVHHAGEGTHRVNMTLWTCSSCDVTSRYSRHNPWRHRPIMDDNTLSSTSPKQNTHVPHQTHVAMTINCHYVSC